MKTDITPQFLDFEKLASLNIRPVKDLDRKLNRFRSKAENPVEKQVARAKRAAMLRVSLQKNESIQEPPQIKTMSCFQFNDVLNDLKTGAEKWPKGFGRAKSAAHALAWEMNCVIWAAKTLSLRHSWSLWWGAHTYKGNETPAV